MKARFECRYRDCERDAHRGWTTCNAHHTAGMNRRQWQTAEAKRRAKGKGNR